MKRDAYLEDPDVSDFVAWASNLVTGEWGLHHSWTGKQGNIPNFGFRCDSLYEAYTHYDWYGNFEGAVNLMDDFRSKLQDAIGDGDSTRFLDTAISIMKWGGIHNERRLPGLGSRALDVLTEAGSKLDPGLADTDELAGFGPMGSGYSKIYSLLLDDFPIYDSRVACAMTSLIRLF